jgi:hypothetical protein
VLGWVCKLMDWVGLGHIKWTMDNSVVSIILCLPCSFAYVDFPAPFLQLLIIQLCILISQDHP